MHSPTQMLIRDPQSQQPWLAQARHKAASDAANQALTKPGDFDSILSECTFKEWNGSTPETKSGFHHVIDSHGEIVATGGTKEQACWYARRVKFSSINTPGNYYPALAGCSFGIETQDGVSFRTVTALHTQDGKTSVRVLARGSDKESVAKQANICLMRERPAQELTVDEFSHLCLLITLETGRSPLKSRYPLMQNGPWLRSSHLALPSPDNLALRQAITHEARILGIENHKRVRWCEDRFNSILNTDLAEAENGIDHIELVGPVYVVLRSSPSQSRNECIQATWRAVLNPVVQEEAPAAERELLDDVDKNAMRVVERQQ